MNAHTLTHNTLRQRMKPDGTNFNGASGTTTLTSDALDTRGWEGVFLQIGFGAIAGSSATTIKVQHSSDDGVLDAYADIAGTSQAMLDTDDFKVFEVNIYRPLKRYLKVITTRATAASTVDFLMAMLYRGTNLPATQGATVGGTENFNSPAAGTA